MSDYNDVVEMLSNLYDEVSGIDFYEYIFPDNESSGELNYDYSHPNAIYLYENDEGKMKRRVMLKDTWEDDYCEYVMDNGTTLCGGLTYRGRANKLEKAQCMNALIFDLDGVGEYELRNIIYRMNLPSEQIRAIAVPTFIVASGSGLHLYYVFDEPVELYPNIKLQLKALKYDLTFKFWEYKATSKEKQIQYQSINQSFRMVGSINNKSNRLVRAFKTGERVSLATLNRYANHKENQVDINKRFRPSKMTREEAKEKYPEWYERVIEGKYGKNKMKKWDIKGKVNGDNPYALYDWWRKQITSIRGGHRYFYLMCLSIYACKCDVPKKKLKEDMQEDFEILSKECEHINPLQKQDMDSALECYSKEYYNFTIDDIEKLTDIRIERNKRNGRKQKDHIKLMNFVRDEINGNKNWRNKEGRPTAEITVKEWRESNPEGTKAECHRQTGLDPKTIRKWW